ncbi:hypothetical protein MK079_02710 [Candidatus Gracilibacteria bacterium]|nr:hypothetical protein [Candidatus Gracilibacteria bacterium]
MVNQSNVTSSVVDIFTREPIDIHHYKDTASQAGNILDIPPEYTLVLDDMRYSISLKNHTSVDDSLEYILNEFLNEFDEDIHIYPGIKNIPIKKQDGKYCLKGHAYLSFPRHVYLRFRTTYIDSQEHLSVV